jgi:hypothetical protein
MGVKLGLSLQGKGQRSAVFENRMLWRIFGPERDDVIRSWRKLHNELLDSLPCIRISTSRRWAGHVAHGKEVHKESVSVKITKMSSFAHRGTSSL